MNLDTTLFFFKRNTNLLTVGKNELSFEHCKLTDDVGFVHEITITLFMTAVVDEKNVQEK